MRQLILFLVQTFLATTAFGMNVLTAAPAYTDTAGKRDIKDTSTFVCHLAEEPPQFPGGHTAMLKFMADHMRYPGTPETEDLRGRIVLQFNVSDRGLIDSVTVIRSLHPQLDSAAIHMIRQMPPWEPARQSGKPVKATMVLPVKFNPE